MGRIRTFDIVLDNNSVAEVRGVPIYRPGGHLTGVVHLTLNTPREDVTEISIKLQGRAKTNWTEVVRTPNAALTDHQQVTFTGIEVYIDEKMSLWQRAHSNQRLNRGPFQLPFQFHIPAEDLPPAYEGPGGHVRYRLMCEISGESSLSYTKTTKTIGIAGRPLDLNSVPNAMLPIHGESESLMSSLCCITGSIKVQASADRRAYVPGETAYITAIINGSNGRRYNVVMDLIEEATFRGTGSVFTSPGVSVTRPGSCQRSREVIRKKTSGVLQRRGETTLQREPLVIPDFKPIVDSGFTGCSIIDVNYFIRVSPILSRLHRSADTEVLLPIFIGRVPFSALPSYHASASHLVHPVEPPPSYEIATSFRYNTPQEHVGGAFVNQAYSPITEDTTTPHDPSGLTVALPPVAANSDASAHQWVPGERQQSQSVDQHDSRPAHPRPRPVIPPPGIRSSAVTGTRGIVNPVFTTDTRDEQDGSAEESRGRPTNEEASSPEVRQESTAPVEDEPLPSPLPPPPLLSSPTEEVSKDRTINTAHDTRLRDVRKTRLKQEERRDRAFSRESATYFLPKYERQLLGRVTSQDDTEEDAEPAQVRLHSFFLPISAESESVEILGSDLAVEQTAPSRETLPPPSPWKDEQPNLSVVPIYHEEASTSPEVQTLILEEPAATASIFLNQEAAPQVIKTDDWEKYTAPETDNEDDSENKITAPDVPEDNMGSKSSETSFVPVHATPQKSKKPVGKQDLNHSPSTSGFVELPPSESREVSPGQVDRSKDSIQRSKRPPRLAPSSNLSNQWPDDSPLSPSKESLFGNVRIVHDTLWQHSRTPSPYFHPDEGRWDQDEVSSVSSFGSYSPSAHTPRERSCARSSDVAGRREVSTLPKGKPSSRGLRESALASLDTRKRGLRHSTSHPITQDSRGSSSERQRGSRKERNSSSDLHPRPDLRRVQKAISLPTMDQPWTASSSLRMAALRLDRDIYQSRSQGNKNWHTVDGAQFSTLPEDHSHRAHDTSPTHLNAAGYQENVNKKRSSKISATANQQNEEPRLPPAERRKTASSAPSVRQYHQESVTEEGKIPKLNSSLPYYSIDRAYWDEQDGLESDKHRLETFV
ncbi:uncharacterized protein LOC110973578 [Acanthaster planci]|uniref:Uncharacterized protein LOC110973578 n=1 Tax=Acanthaster planci TaxID=133434 RepID=A0A8B7XJ72_ACAPL|nr:uncharacterized protein LOC110973578 [Acanthaster planci]